MPVLPQYEQHSTGNVGLPDNPTIQPGILGKAFQVVGGVVHDIEQQRNATETVNNRLQAAQGLADLREQADRKPWGERKEFFEKGAKTLLGDINGNFSDSRTATAFQEHWNALYLPNRVEVDHSAYQGEKDYNRANLDQTLNTFAAQIAQAPSEQQAEILRNQAVSTVSDFTVSGWITAQEGTNQIQELQRRTDKNRVLSMIIGKPGQPGNPTAALKMLADPARFAGLREEDRIALQQHADSAIQHQMAAADHQMIVNERARKLAGDQLAKEGEDLIVSGQMTEEWFNQHRSSLEPSDYRILRHAAQEGGGVDSAPFLADTYDRLYNRGEDVGAVVVEGLRTHLLSATTAKSLLNENQQTQGMQSPRQQGLKYIMGALKVSELNPDPAAAQRQADAVAEFNRQVKVDPKSDPMTIARDLSKRYALIDWHDMMLTAPLPKYAIGTRDALDIPGSMKATNDFFIKKHNGDMAAAIADPEYAREALLLKRWKEAWEKQQAQAASSGAPAK